MYYFGSFIFFSFCNQGPGCLLVFQQYFSRYRICQYHGGSCFPGQCHHNRRLNGGTVYYGEGPWPTGGMDLNAYLEFSITPKPGNNLTISSLVMKIRRSTTGSSGAGPNTWSLHSSLDAYATDIASGVLTLNSTPAKTVTLGVAYINLPAKITFRLYGYIRLSLPAD